TDESWKGRVGELRGDISLLKGYTDAAYSAYTEEQQAVDASHTLQIKLDDLAKSGALNEEDVSQSSVVCD
ncbi:tetratricopeptide repeat protein, partial [Vibrio echinoideorum]